LLLSVFFSIITFRYYILDTNTEINAIASFSENDGISTPSLVNNSSKENALEHAKKHTDPTYICPMHSDVLSNDPGSTCPICGMDLVIIDNIDGEEGIVSISPRIINLLGVKTKKVKKTTLYRRINSVGNIKYDENRIRHIHLRTDGWVEHLAVKTLGERIKKGDLLFKVYSPKLVKHKKNYYNL